MSASPDFSLSGGMKNPGATPAAARLLVVEDNDLIRLLVANMLMGAGYAVHLANNGRQALERLRQHSMDLVVTDIFMPEMDGLQLIAALKSTQPELPIIAMSGGSVESGSYLQRARELGATRTLAKPFLREEMLLAVSHVLSKQRTGVAGESART